MRRVSAMAMANLSKSLANEELSASLASVLLMIEANPGRTQAQIARKLAIKRANIAPMIAKLEEDNLVEKHTIDGRSFSLTITPEGMSRAASLASVFSAHDELVFGSLSQTERTQFARLLLKIWIAISEST